VVICWSCFLFFSAIKFFEWCPFSWGGVVFCAVFLVLVLVLMQILIVFSKSEKSTAPKNLDLMDHPKQSRQKQKTYKKQADNNKRVANSNNNMKRASYSNSSHISITATKSNKILKRNNFTIKYCNKEISKSYESTCCKRREGSSRINGCKGEDSGTFEGRGDEEDDNGDVRNSNLRT
ncbi:hypothetical protein HAX54_036271, partial [Datura stramonium]|nr:hypothetical protein [Datura stramonium]